MQEKQKVSMVLGILEFHSIDLNDFSVQAAL
jgi:hypothetical protein